MLVSLTRSTVIQNVQIHYFVIRKQIHYFTQRPSLANSKIPMSIHVQTLASPYANKNPITFENKLNLELTPEHVDAVAVRYVDLRHIIAVVDSFIRWPINEADVAPQNVAVIVLRLTLSPTRPNPLRADSTT